MCSDDSNRAREIAADICRAATVCQMRDDADELAAIVRAVEAPLPVLPFDVIEREEVLKLTVLRGRDRERRLLAILLGDDSGQ